MTLNVLVSRYRSAMSPNIPVWAYLTFLLVGAGWAFLVPTYWVFLGSVACVTAITALGLTVLVGWGGQISLAQAALTGTSLYVAGYLVREDTVGFPFLLALAIGVLVATVLGTLPAIATAKLSGIYVMVLTLGLQMTIERTIFASEKLTGGRSIGTQDFHERPEFLVSFSPERSFYLLVFGTLVAVMVGLTLFRSSRHGRALLLVRTNREAAAAVGISPLWYKVLAFAVAGALAGLAGSLSAPLYRAPPSTVGYFTIPSLFLLAIPVAAGFESLFAVVVVSFAFTMTPFALESLNQSPFLLGGIALVAGTYVGPKGLGGAVLDLMRQRATRSSRSSEDLSGTAELVVPVSNDVELAVPGAGAHPSSPDSVAPAGLDPDRVSTQLSPFRREV